MKYRNCVCAVLRRRSDGSLLVCHRKGFAPNEGWQFPQGGYDESLGLISEMKRELREEIGTDLVRVVCESVRSYSYDFPADKMEYRPGYAGQKQRWVLAEFLGNDEDLRFDHEPAEFDSYKWVEPAEAFNSIVNFKRNVYKEALGDFGLLNS